MKVNASMACEVELSQEEAFRALVDSFGVTDIVFPENARDRIWQYDRDSQSLMEYRDASYHGSPDWTPTGNAITDREAIEIVRQLTGMREYIDRHGQREAPAPSPHRVPGVSLRGAALESRAASQALADGRTCGGDRVADAR